MENRRLRALRKALKEKKIPAFLVSRPENVRYLSGFTGSNGSLVVAQDKAFLLTDFRYQEQAAGETEGFEIKVGKSQEELEGLAKLFAKLNLKSVGFEAHILPFKTCKELVKKARPILLKPLSEMVENIRVVKEEKEITKIKKAAKLGDEAFTHILPFIKPGVSEKELALELEFFMRKNGAEKASFDIILASGANTSKPHAKISTRILKTGDFVLLDFGAVFEGYHSDMTRTVVLGKASKRQKRIYNLVLEAQEKVLKGLSVGRTGAEVDKIARAQFNRAGVKTKFGHNLGHGVGLEIHERPILGPKSKEVLKRGMVFTIEPGLYFRHSFGVRIEDLVVLREEEPEILTKSPKELIEI